MKSIATLLVVISLSASQSPLGAPSLFADTTHARFGTTAIKFDSTFLSVLNARGIDVEAIVPAFFVAEKDVFRFPICGGGVDLPIRKGEISHSGGLRFVQNTHALSLTEFFLEIPREDSFGPIGSLSALITADHSLIGRDDIFDLDFTNAETVLSFPSLFAQRIFITNVTARLSENGAQQFNQAFGTSFGFGASVGVFTIRIITTEEL